MLSLGHLLKAQLLDVHSWSGQAILTCTTPRRAFLVRAGYTDNLAITGFRECDSSTHFPGQSRLY